jgi:hypothetical protein
VAIVERVRDEDGDKNGEKSEDAVRKLQTLRKAVARARGMLATDGVSGHAPTAISQRLSDIAAEMQSWDDCLEEIRSEFADLLAERDRSRIAHDKLRERIDHHPLQPRSEPDRKAPGASGSLPRARPTAGESQDFTAIDRELERLNASMLRAFSSE